MVNDDHPSEDMSLSHDSLADPAKDVQLGADEDLFLLADLIGFALAASPKPFTGLKIHMENGFGTKTTLEVLDGLMYLAKE